MAKALTKAQLKAQEIAESIAYLRKLGVKPGSQLYTNVTHVARSGMSRTIKVYVSHKGEIVNVTGHVATIINCRWTNGGVVMGGCGMDMCFQTIYLLGRAMFPKGGPLDKSPRQAQEKRDGQTIERDGGYLLTNRNL